MHNRIILTIDVKDRHLTPEAAKECVRQLEFALGGEVLRATMEQIHPDRVTFDLKEVEISDAEWAV